MTKRRYTTKPLCCSVDNGPKNESEWQAAAARIGCNDTRRYHCVSDKFRPSLVEFCNNKTRLLVDKNKIFSLLSKICWYKFILQMKKARMTHYSPPINIIFQIKLDCKFDQLYLSLFLKKNINWSPFTIKIFSDKYLYWKLFYYWNPNQLFVYR